MSFANLRAPLENRLRMAIQSTGNDFNQFRSAANNLALPQDAQRMIETAITTVGTDRLQIGLSMINGGLTTPLPGWWGVPQIGRGKVSPNAGYAKRSFVPDTRGERQVANLGYDYWPVFCTSDDFSFDIRTLETAGRVNYQIDTVHAEAATRNCNYAIEDQILNGLTDSEGNVMTINGLGAPGLLSSPHTFTYSTWTGLTGAQILDAIQAGIAILRGNKYFGPYDVWLPSNYTEKLGKDYTTGYPKTIMSRLKELGPYGGRALNIDFADLLPDDRVIIYQATKDNIDIVYGQGPTPVSWTDGPKFNTYWIVLACAVFRMFQNTNGDYGVVVGDLA